MRVARRLRRSNGVLNTGANAAGIVSAPVIGPFSGAGHWNTTFVIAAAFAFVGAACWWLMEPDRHDAA